MGELITACNIAVTKLIASRLLVTGYRSLFVYAKSFVYCRKKEVCTLRRCRKRTHYYMYTKNTTYIDHTKNETCHMDGTLQKKGCPVY
jgi:hypothetical protein